MTVAAKSGWSRITSNKTTRPGGYEGRREQTMKVRELINHAHLLAGQKTILHDMGETKKNYTSVDRYAFELDSDTVEYLLRLKVNTFRCNNAGLEIYAE